MWGMPGLASVASVALGQAGIFPDRICVNSSLGRWRCCRRLPGNSGMPIVVAWCGSWEEA